MDQTTNYLQTEIKNLESKIAENKTLLNDESLKALAQEEISRLEEQKKALEKSLNDIENGSGDDDSGAEDENGAVINTNICSLEIRSGTGGDEAGLFAGDLLKMYMRFGETQGWHVKEIFRSENEVGGLKTVVVEIRGNDVYNLLRNESGTHRVQRIPVTESGGRIHTSTATVAILPKLKKVDIEIKPENLKWEFFRSGGKGGQNVNKVSTAVRLIHLPTNEVVECQEERFQLKNREKALEMLKSRLYTAMQEQQVKSISDLRSNQVGTGERNEKIRTYNYPQDRITDHRVKKSWHGIEKRMNGDIGEILSELTVLHDEER